MRWFRGVFLLVLSGSYAWSQAADSTLVGTVSDTGGAVVRHASVVVVNTATNLARTVLSNDSGNYSVVNLPPGLYRIEVELAGFKKAVKNGVRLQIDESERIDFVLEVGQATEVIEVTTAAPMLRTDDSSMGGVIGEQAILDLPLNGRQFETLVQLVPGVVTPAPGSHLSSRGGFNVAGMDEHANSYFLDGIDNVDPVIRNFSFRPSLDLIQEFKVGESGHEAEFGRNAGAVINVRTRSGTNAFHGSVWEFLRNDNLDARNFFALPDAAKPPLIRNQFGATLGGPVRPGRTFFFAGYEGLRQKAGTVHRATVPTARMRVGDLSEFGGVLHDPLTGQVFASNLLPNGRIDPIAREVIQAYPLPNRPGISRNRVETANRIEDGNDLSVRIDHALTNRTNIVGRVSSSVTRVLDPFRTETGGSANLADFGQTADRLRTNVGVAVTTVRGSNFVHEFRAGYNRFNQPVIASNPGTPLQAPLMSLVRAFQDFNIPGFDSLGSGPEFKRVVNVYNYIDNVSYTIGNHQLKAGADVRRYLFNSRLASPNVFIFDGTRYDPRQPEPGMKDFLLGLPGLTFSMTGSVAGNARKFELAAYVQDDWKVTPRLTLNYGLRWEFYGRISEKTNKQSMWLAACNCVAVAGKDIGEKLVENDFNNYAPRFGLAFRPFSGPTAIRASAGIFYDNDMRHNSEVIGNPPFVLNRFYPAVVIPALSLSNPFPANTGISTLAPWTLDVHYRDTYVEQWNLSIQHEVSPGLLAEVGYVGNHMVKARRARNLNQRVNGVLPHPGFAQIMIFEQAGSSNFNALQAHLEGRLARGLGFTSSYTWSHAIDDRPAGRVQDNNNMHAERGDSDFDARHRLTFSGIYKIPSDFARRRGRVASTVLGGWSVSGIGIVQGGRPFTVFLTQEVSGAGNLPPADRPNLVPGVSWRPQNQGPDQWINPAAFGIPGPRAFGNAGRNILRGPRLHNLDLALLRDSRAGERATLQFRAEFFNVLNHPNFALPNAALDASLNPAANFGVISSTIMPERQIQFGLRVGF